MHIGPELGHRPHAGPEVTKHGDLWELFAKIVEQRGPYDTKISKVKAHATLNEVVSGAVVFSDYVGNNLADTFAKAAAKSARWPGIIEDQVEENERLAFMVCMLAALSKH